MKIKLAILESDENYLKRIVSVYTNKFSDKLQVYSFTDADVALKSLEKSRIDVFISSDKFAIDTSTLPRYCGFAYLVESPNIESYRNELAICKFQKPEIIYKIILDIFSENIPESIGLNFELDSSVRIITFASASGGVGCSTSAVACAKALNKMGRKVLYLNFERFGYVESFFSGDGQTDFGDVIFTLKSKKANLALRLESNVRQDVSGVFFYASSPTVLDLMELNPEEVQRFLSELKSTGSYDDIVIDLDFSFESNSLKILEKSTMIIFVTDGSKIANDKFRRVYQAVEIIEERSNISLIPRIGVFYNRFSSKHGEKLDLRTYEIGGVPRYKQATTDQVIDEIVNFGIFQNI